MILALLVITLAFYWLLRETDWMTIRLPYGKAIELIAKEIKTPDNVVAIPLPISTPILLLTQYCEMTRLIMESKL